MLNSPTGEMVSEEVKRRGLDERAKRLRPLEYEQYKQNTLLVEYMRSLRDHVSLWLRGLGVDSKAIHAVLGGRMDSANGSPDGQARVTGAVWAQAIAASITTRR